MAYTQKTSASELGGSGSGFAQAAVRDFQWCIDQIKALLGGASGSIGGVWFWGHGLPSDTLGKDGDLYLNIDTADVYGKENGTWL